MYWQKVVFLDTTENHRGSGQYLEAFELVCAGLVSCLNISARVALDNRNIKCGKVVVKVDIDRSHEKVK